MADQIDGRVAELLDAKNFAQVATVKKDGTPFVTPVWVDHENGQVLLNTAEGRAWPQHIRRTGKVALNVQNLENPYEYVLIQGSVAEDTHEGADEHIDKMAQKYIGEEKYPFRAPGEQRVLFRIQPDKISHTDQTS
jgi:PPOX class probable F420-dependent enzyme